MLAFLLFTWMLSGPVHSDYSEWWWHFHAQIAFLDHNFELVGEPSVENGCVWVAYVTIWNITISVRTLLPFANDTGIAFLPMVSIFLPPKPYNEFRWLKCPPIHAHGLPIHVCGAACAYQYIVQGISRYVCCCDESITVRIVAYLKIRLIESDRYEGPS